MGLDEMCVAPIVAQVPPPPLRRPAALAACIAPPWSVLQPSRWRCAEEAGVAEAEMTAGCNFPARASAASPPACSPDTRSTAPAHHPLNAPRRQVSHILLPAEQKALAPQLRQRIQAGEASLASLAEEHSKCPSRRCARWGPIRC